MLTATLMMIKSELEEFEEVLKSSLTSSVEGFDIVLDYFFSSQGKKIRPILGILFSKIMGQYNEQQRYFLLAIELIHNATLFHDDVIDGADYRRNQESLNRHFSSKIAILAGDYFLATALKNISQINSLKINNIIASSIKEICEGEIEQDLSLKKLSSMEQYLLKTQRKTAILFALTLQGCAMLADNFDEDNIEAARKLGENFGMIFQIRDDLKNFEASVDKPIFNDLRSGNYTAPIIFLAQKFPEVKELLNIENYDAVMDLLHQSDAIEKTKKMLENYYLRATQILSKFPDNEYSRQMKELLSYFRNN